MSNPAFEFVRQLGTELAAGEFDLPPFPDTAMRVQRCVADKDSDINALGVIIAGEPALAARLMRMANSAMMRRGPMEVTDINTAISRVGMEMVLNAAVSFAAREAFNFPAGSPFIEDLNALRRRSVKVASLSYVLAKHSRFPGKPDEAMLAGLLHAVGKFYILTKASDFPELFTNRDTVDELMKQWHSGVARAIIESWNFPDSIAIGVDEQEIKERDRISSSDVSDILFIANLLAKSGVNVAGELGNLDALARLRMDCTKLAKLLEENADEIQSMTDALTA